MRQRGWVAIGFVSVLAGLALGERLVTSRVEAQGGPAAPAFQVDPAWPTVPAQWTLGQVSGVAVDSRDHVWILQRPWSLDSDEKAPDADAACCHPAPPVMEFDASWPLRPGLGRPRRGLRVAGRRARHLRRPQGQRVGVVGRRAAPARRQGELHRQVHPRREVPAPDRPPRDEQGLARHGQLQQPRRHLRPSADQRGVRRRRLRQPAGDRARRRHRPVQADVGRLRQRPRRRRAEDGELRGARAAAVQPRARRAGVEGRARLRRRPAQQPHAGVRARRHVRARDLRRAADQAARHRLRRSASRPTRHSGGCISPTPATARSMSTIGDPAGGGAFGRIGRYAGQFVFLHALAVDSHGNLYTAEVGDGRRVQKFVVSRR